MGIKDNLLHKRLSYEIIGCAFESFKKVGVGFDEIRYHKIFDRCLNKKGLNPEYKVPVKLFYRSKCIAEFEIDEIVEDKIIIELKCIQTDFIPENYAQIMTYLKASNKKLGILINFGLHKAITRRVIFNEKRKPDYEQWDNGYFNDPVIKNIINLLIESVRLIDKDLGVGYHKKIYQSAIAIELGFNSIDYDESVFIETIYENIEFAPFKIDYWLVQNAVLLGILAGNDKPRVYDIFRMRTYLKLLNLKHGLIVYWSNKNLQLYGIYEA